MTKREDFTPEEWSVLASLGQEVAQLLKAAAPGGDWREAFAIGKALFDAPGMFSGSELIADVVADRGKASPTPVETAKPSAPGSELQQREATTLAYCRMAAGALQRVATPEESEQYRRFIGMLGERVAAAAKEGDESIAPAERRILDEVALALTLAPAGPVAAPPPPGQLLVTVTYVDGTALSPQAEITLRLLGGSKSSWLGLVVAEQKQTADGRQAPLQFVMQIDPTTIDPAQSYVVQATITLDNRVIFISSGNDRVLTQGNPSTVELVVSPVS